MASIPCSIHLYPIPSRSSTSTSKVGSSSSSLSSLRSSFLGLMRCLRKVGRISLVPAASALRVSSWFRLGKNGVDAEGAGIYGSKSWNDFDRDDVEKYFNDRGMLAVEGSYDKMEALLSQNIHPVDILLLMASSEGDKPKIEELLRAGAKYHVTDVEGRTALDRAASEEIKDFILGFCVWRRRVFSSLFVFVFPFVTYTYSTCDQVSKAAAFRYHRMETALIAYNVVNT